MRGLRLPSHVRVAFTAAWLVAVPAFAQESPPFSGVARDSLGNVLADVRVLILPERLGASPVGERRTTAGGRFTFGDVAPGIYRIAAVKQGYLTFLGTVNTAVRPSLNIVLQSSPSRSTSAAETGDAAWSLRLPRRSILRDVQPVAAPGIEDPVAGGGSPTTPSPGSEGGLRGRIEHWSAVAGTARDAEAGILGNETRIDLALPTFRDVSMTVSGYRESSTLDPVHAGQAAPGLQQAGARWGLSSGLGSNADVAVSAYYDRGRLSPSSPDPGGAERLDQSVWGYGATWSRELEDRSSVLLGLEYRDAVLGLPDAPLDRMPAGHRPQAAEISNRMVGAMTSFEQAPGERHRFRMAVRALRATLPDSSVRVAFPAPPAGMSVEDGWSVGLAAEDRWGVSRAWAVIYGLACRESPSVSGASPRLGAAWSGERGQAQLILSYPIAAHDPGSAPGALGPLDAGRTLGYEVALQGALPGGFRIRAHRRYEPARYGLAPPDGGSIRRPIYLTGGNASVLENVVAVERNLGAARVFVEASRGVAEGSVARVPEIDFPVVLLADRELAFDAAAVGVRLAPTRTEIVTEYQQVLEAPSLGARAPTSTHELVELRIAQELGRNRSGSTSWRLLMAARSTRTTLDGYTSPDTDVALDGLATRFSAGISVAF